MSTTAPSHGSFGIQPMPARAGIGLRLPHHQWVIDRSPVAAWLEVHPENYMSDGIQRYELDVICQDYPLSLHAVGLSLGSASGVQNGHLDHLGKLIARYQPALVSDHLSWSNAGGMYFPDLLPLPYTEEALELVARNIDRVQTALKRTLLVENPSTYLRFANSVLTEAEFLAALVQRCGCGVLLDVNNIYVSARNLGEDPANTLAGHLETIPAASIGEIHLAGHSTRALQSGIELRIDDHGSLVCPDVWLLYEEAISELGARPTLIEWDTDIPAFEKLQGQASIAQAVLDASVRRGAQHAIAG